MKTVNHLESSVYVSLISSFCPDLITWRRDEKGHLLRGFPAVHWPCLVCSSTNLYTIIEVGNKFFTRFVRLCLATDLAGFFSSVCAVNYLLETRIIWAWKENLYCNLLSWKFEWEQILGRHWYWRYFNLPHNHFRSIKIHVLILPDNISNSTVYLLLSVSHLLIYTSGGNKHLNPLLIILRTWK